MTRFTLLLALVLLGTGLIAQSFITIENASFETGIAQRGKRGGQVPGWIDCGPRNETAPDVHSELSDFFGVMHSAAEGINFLMLVTRDNNTQEILSAPLPQPLLKDSTYLLSVFLARPPTCVSRSKKFNVFMEYNRGVVLRLFGAKRGCDPKQLLAESPVITDTDWNEHQFLLLPENDYKYLLIQAYYENEQTAPYNGSILLDNIKLVNNNDRHQPMHKMIPSGKTYEWPSALKIEKMVAEIAPELKASKNEQSEQFIQQYPALIYLYALLELEHHLSTGGDLYRYMQQSSTENITFTVEALRYIHAYPSADAMEQMHHYYQLFHANSISFNEATSQMDKLEKTFETLWQDDEIMVKRVRHILAHRSTVLQQLRLALIDLLGGHEVLNLVKKE